MRIASKSISHTYPAQMKKYLRSICSTCSHLANCSLTTYKDNISSCSEYVHHLDNDPVPTMMGMTEDDSHDHKNYEPKEMILN